MNANFGRSSANRYLYAAVLMVGDPRSQRRNDQTKCSPRAGFFIIGLCILAFLKPSGSAATRSECRGFLIDSLFGRMSLQCQRSPGSNSTLAISRRRTDRSETVPFRNGLTFFEISGFGCARSGSAAAALIRNVKMRSSRLDGANWEMEAKTE